MRLLAIPWQVVVELAKFATQLIITLVTNKKGKNNGEYTAKGSEEQQPHEHKEEPAEAVAGRDKE